MRPSDLSKLSPKLIETCAALVGCDAHTPAELAIREGVPVNTIHQRRRRAEKKLGVILPRLHRVGRPRAA